MAAALSTNSGNPGGSHYEEGRACALAGVSATRSFLLSPTDAPSALNAELTLSFENSTLFFCDTFPKYTRYISKKFTVLPACAIQILQAFDSTAFRVLSIILPFVLETQ